MMFSPGNLLLFTPFYFKNSAVPKNKFFVVLHKNDEGFILGSLPTSRDHLPDDLKKHGCVRCDKRQIICYCFKQGVVVTKAGGFQFEKNTYLYGKELNDYTVPNLK